MSPQTARGANMECVRRVLASHVGVADALGDYCACGWRGESWQSHVARLIVNALHPQTVSSR